MRRIEEAIEYWKQQEELAREKRKTETIANASGIAFGPTGVHSYSTPTDSAIGAFIQWRRELEKYRDLFDSFRRKKDEWLKEEAIAAAEEFYMDSISHHTAWGIPERDWLITLGRGCEISFELIRHPAVILSITFGSSGRPSIHYLERKNFRDFSWKLKTSGRNCHPLLANHIVRRAMVYDHNSKDEWKYSPTDFYNNRKKTG